jgi:hypothetical protein
VTISKGRTSRVGGLAIPRRWTIGAVVIVAQLSFGVGGAANASVRASTLATTPDSIHAISHAADINELSSRSAPAVTVKLPAKLWPVQLGDFSTRVRRVQRALVELGYWLAPVNGYFGDSTQQAVYALQKAAGIARTGVVGASTYQAIANGVVPKPRSKVGRVVEVNLQRDLVLIVNNGKLLTTLNTSTGGGYTYCVARSCSVAITPTGHFSIVREVDGIVTDALGQLWRPKYFYSGFAIHGDSYVPAYPVSHGCVRVSDEAINWIWDTNQMPLGTKVWIY